MVNLNIYEHANYAKNCGIKKQVLVENDVVLLDNNNSKIIERFPGRTFKRK